MDAVLRGNEQSALQIDKYAYGYAREDGPRKPPGDEMRDDEKLGSLLLVLAIGLIYQAIAGCKDLCSLRWPSVPTIKTRWPD